MATELAINPRLAQYVVQTIGRLLSAFAILQGLTILTGGRGRWTGASFATALLLPGAPPTWGILFGGLGIAAIWGTFQCKRLLVAWSMYGCAAWSLFFAVGFAVTAFQNRHAALTGIWSYLVLAIIYVLIGVTYKESRKLER